MLNLSAMLDACSSSNFCQNARSPDTDHSDVSEQSCENKRTPARLIRQV